MTILQNPTSDIKPNSTSKLNTIKKETCVDILSMLERCIIDGHDCNTFFLSISRYVRETRTINDNDLQ